jgi:hypothetical protein
LVAVMSAQRNHTPVLSIMNSIEYAGGSGLTDTVTT